jgi:hypothetical protein
MRGSEARKAGAGGCEGVSCSEDIEIGGAVAERGTLGGAGVVSVGMSGVSKRDFLRGPVGSAFCSTCTEGSGMTDCGMMGFTGRLPDEIVVCLSSGLTSSGSPILTSSSDFTSGMSMSWWEAGRDLDGLREKVFCRGDRDRENEDLREFERKLCRGDRRDEMERLRGGECDRLIVRR